MFNSVDATTVSTEYQTTPTHISIDSFIYVIMCIEMYNVYIFGLCVRGTKLLLMMLPESERTGRGILQRALVLDSRNILLQNLRGQNAERNEME